MAYKLVEALYEVMQRDAEDVDYLMENVAIATVGDVMDLCGENRIFVKQGLEMLKRTRNEGLKALMECTNVPVDRLNAYHIGSVSYTHLCDRKDHRNKEIFLGTACGDFLCGASCTRVIWTISVDSGQRIGTGDNVSCMCRWGNGWRNDFVIDFSDRFREKKLF